MVKKTTNAKKNTDRNYKKCAKCEKTRIDTDFYTADSLLYSDGRFTICKTCIDAIVQDRGFNGFMAVLRAMNRPFLQDIWEGDHRNYIRMISSLRQYRGMTFDDSSLHKGVKNNDVFEDDEFEEFEITPAMRRFWRGYDDDQIRILEDYYQDLISVYECETPVQRSIYRNMAITQYMADNASSATEFDKLVKTLSSLMNDANVKPVQESGAHDSSLSTWGEWIKKIEETEPIPEPQEEFKDVDGIRKYINKWFVSHFAKIFGISANDDVPALKDEDFDNADKVDGKPSTGDV